MARPYDDEPPPQMRSSPFPPWTRGVRALAIALAAVFVLEFALYFSGSSAFASALKVLSLNPDQWFSGPWYAPLWQLGSYGFLHDTRSAWHLLGNLLILYFFGSAIESRLGTRRFLITYFAGQLCGALLHLGLSAAGLELGSAIGASGAAYALVIALATLAPNDLVYVFFLPLRMRWLAIGLVGLAIFGALVDYREGSGSVAHFIHLGGAAYGFFAVRSGLIRRDPIEALERRRAVREVERAAEDEVRMDQLLDKIHREGMSSLTSSEREFLKRTSTRR